MHPSTLLTDDDAVSPALGLVLFGLIVLIVATAVGVIVFTASDSVGRSTPTAAFTFAFDSEADSEVDDFGVLYTTNGTAGINESYDRAVTDFDREQIGLVRVTYTDGRPLEAGRLSIAGNRLTDRHSWATAWSEYNDSESVSNGQHFELWMHVKDELRITWAGEDDSAVLQRYERPNR